MSKPKPSAPQISKGQYIRDHQHLTPRQLIAKAKSEGITLTSAVVYSTRYEAKKKQAKQASTGELKLDDHASIFRAALSDRELRARIVRYGTQTVRAVLDAMERGE